MKHKVNNYSVFLPQRILSVEDKTVSGLYLNESLICNISVDSDFEKILQAQSDGRLAANNQDSPFLVMFLGDNGSSYVFYDNKRKVLFCQSYLDGGYVHILKLAKRKDFSLEDKSDLLEYINKNTGTGDKASERVEVDIDGNIYHIGHGDDFSFDGFLCASATPYLRMSSVTSIGISRRGYSMVVLDVKSSLSCVERYDIIVGEDMAKAATPKSENAPLVGLDAYYRKLKSSR